MTFWNAATRRTSVRCTMHLLIYIPSRESVKAQHMKSVVSLIMTLVQAGVSVSFDTHIGESLISRARNHMCHKFLTLPAWKTCTHVLFIDDDIVFDPGAIVHLLKSGADLCGLPVPLRGHNPGQRDALAKTDHIKQLEADGKLDARHREMLGTRFAVNLMPGSTHSFEKGMLAVKEFGSAVMMISRAALTKIEAESGPDLLESLTYDSNYVSPDPDSREFKGFFSVMRCPDSGRMLSEDYSFCYRARAVGIVPKIFPTTTVGHIGATTYFGNFFLNLSAQIVKSAPAPAAEEEEEEAKPTAFEEAMPVGTVISRADMKAALQKLEEWDLKLDSIPHDQMLRLVDLLVEGDLDEPPSFLLPTERPSAQSRRRTRQRDQERRRRRRKHH